MARIKNAITGYFVDAWDMANPPTTATLELAQWISNVTDDSDEETEDVGYYDGDGTPETNVLTVKKTYTFEGTYDDENPAMAFVKGLEFATGNARKVAFRQVRTDGSELFGRATISGIKVTGGEATEYPVFECTISWDATPTITPPGP